MSRRLIRYVGLILAGMVAAGGGAAEPLVLDTARILLNPENPAQTRVGRLRFLGGLELRSPAPAFGGLSGLALTADGNRMIAVTDRGDWFTARLVESDDGHLVGLADAALRSMLDDNGGHLGAGWRDAEAVELGPSGAIFVSFEHRHRIWRYDGGGGLTPARPVSIASSNVLRQLPPNGGIEALTTLGEGRLLVLSEEGRDRNGDRQGWILQPGGPAPVKLRSSGQFKPTGLAVLPSGDFVLLERRFTFVGGFANRVSRIPRQAVVPNGRLVGELIAELDRPLTTDNFEGIAATTAPDGGTWIYLISDDNFWALQRTLLFKFRLEQSDADDRPVDDR